MDNTLLQYGKPYVSDRALSAIHELLDVGIRFAPASGRAIIELRHFFHDDEAAVSTALTSNGQQIYVDGKLVSSTYLDHGALERACEALHGIGDAGVVVYADAGGDEPSCVVDVDPSTVDVMRHLFPLGLEGCRDLPSRPIVKGAVAVGGDKAQVAHVKGILEDACPEFDFVAPVHNWFDVVPTGWSKASGVRLLKRALDVPLEQIVAFGDSDNDLAMLSYVPNSVAVANANDRATAAATWHVGACEDDAVATAMEQIARAAHEGRLPDFLRD
jgi:hydroxymethylpyrimidine pyrophosphatase-like HAD family hydrolase